VNPTPAAGNDSLASAIHLLSPTARERGLEPTIKAEADFARDCNLRNLVALTK
jgi:hypothetical protein